VGLRVRSSGVAGVQELQKKKLSGGKKDSRF
jgi:hypothetical protein